MNRITKTNSKRPEALKDDPGAVTNSIPFEIEQFKNYINEARKKKNNSRGQKQEYLVPNLLESDIPTHRLIETEDRDSSKDDLDERIIKQEIKVVNTILKVKRGKEDKNLVLNSAMFYINNIIDGRLTTSEISNSLKQLKLLASYRLKVKGRFCYCPLNLRSIIEYLNSFGKKNLTAQKDILTALEEGRKPGFFSADRLTLRTAFRRRSYALGGYDAFKEMICFLGRLIRNSTVIFIIALCSRIIYYKRNPEEIFYYTKGCLLSIKEEFQKIKSKLIALKDKPKRTEETTNDKQDTGEKKE